MVQQLLTLELVPKKNSIPNWRTEELVLDCLEEIVIHGMRGSDLEVALVLRLFH
jgi:hypothetical protein